MRCAGWVIRAIRIKLCRGGGTRGGWFWLPLIGWRYFPDAAAQSVPRGSDGFSVGPSILHCRPQPVVFNAGLEFYLPAAGVDCAGFSGLPAPALCGFGGAVRFGRVIVIATYHLAQLAITAGVLAHLAQS